MRISDWSSDVLLFRSADQRLIQNIDLGQGIGRLVDALNGGIKRASDTGQPADAAFGEVFAKRLDGAPDLPGDRKSVVKGTSVSVRVDIGGRGHITQTVQARTRQPPLKKSTTQRR